MAAVSKSFASTINKWRMMLGGFNKHKADLSYAQKQADELKRLLDEEEALNIKQEQLKADLAKATEQINDKLKEGRKVYAALMRFAKGQFGPSSVEIKDFKPTGEK